MRKRSHGKYGAMAMTPANASGACSPASSATRPPIEMPSTIGRSSSERASSITGFAMTAGVRGCFGIGVRPKPGRSTAIVRRPYRASTVPNPSNADDSRPSGCIAITGCPVPHSRRWSIARPSLSHRLVGRRNELTITNSNGTTGCARSTTSAVTGVTKASRSCCAVHWAVGCRVTPTRTAAGDDRRADAAARARVA